VHLKSDTAASDCLCSRFPGDYAIDWCSTSDQRRADAFAKMGIPAAQRSKACAWATDAFDKEFGWPSIYYSPAAALKARRAFIPGDVDARIVGVGLAEDTLDSFLRDAAPEPQVAGYAPNGEGGYFSIGKRRDPLAHGGRTPLASSIPSKMRNAAAWRSPATRLARSQVRGFLLPSSNTK
jgi:hypothetical protein